MHGRPISVSFCRMDRARPSADLPHCFDLSLSRVISTELRTSGGRASSQHRCLFGTVTAAMISSARAVAEVPEDAADVSGAFRDVLLRDRRETDVEAFMHDRLQKLAVPEPLVDQDFLRHLRALGVRDVRPARRLPAEPGEPHEPLGAVQQEVMVSRHGRVVYRRSQLAD